VSAPARIRRSARRAEYAYPMSSFQGAEKPEKPSLLKRALALVIVAVVIVLVASIVIHFVMAIFWIAVAVAAVIAVLWALNTLL
jgi:hypothetical protein